MKKLWWIGLGSVGVAVGGMVLANYLGRQAGERDLKRLQVIWPKLLDLPSSDRVVIVRSSTNCKMDENNVPKERTAVLACLRSGVVEAERPRLEELINAARP